MKKIMLFAVVALVGVHMHSAQQDAGSQGESKAEYSISFASNSHHTSYIRSDVPGHAITPSRAATLRVPHDTQDAGSQGESKAEYSISFANNSPHTSYIRSDVPGHAITPSRKATLRVPHDTIDIPRWDSYIFLGGEIKGSSAYQANLPKFSNENEAALYREWAYDQEVQALRSGKIRTACALYNAPEGSKDSYVRFLAGLNKHLVTYNSLTGELTVRGKSRVTGDQLMELVEILAQESEVQEWGEFQVSFDGSKKMVFEDFVAKVIGLAQQLGVE